MNFLQASWKTIILYDFLYGFTLFIKPSVVLEVGTGEGGSTIAMARALKDNKTNGKIYSIEIKGENTKKAIKNAEQEKVRKFIQFKQGDSLKVLPELLPILKQVDLLFLDSGEKLNYIKDFKLVEPFLKNETSFIIAHDTSTYQGAEEFDKFIKTRIGYEVCSIPIGAGITIARKTSRIVKAIK